MIHLNPNSSTLQRIRITAQESRAWLAAYTHYLVVFRHCVSRVEIPFIADVSVDNPRYTEFEMYTNSNTPLTGRILLEEPGQYDYEVYGQNSGTNLDPDAGAVVGLVERGVLSVPGESGYDWPTLSIPDNIIYYQ